MKRLLMALVVLTGLIGAGGAVWAQDLNKGMEAYKSGDYVTALKEWRPLADQGNAAAQYNLAFIYNYGNSDAGVTQDDAEAVKWFRKAAEQGHALAQHNLGYKYRKGEGVTQDDAEAVKWYRKAAEQGVAAAQLNLGVMYFSGEGVLQDMIAAHMWFNIAAENGDTVAEENRDIVAGKLSSSDIVKAQNRAKRCMSSGYKDCD